MKAKLRRSAMFIVRAVEKNASPVGAQYQHFAPDGACFFIALHYYKHFVPNGTFKNAIYLNRNRNERPVILQPRDRNAGARTAARVAGRTAALADERAGDQSVLSSQRTRRRCRA